MNVKDKDTKSSPQQIGVVGKMCSAATIGNIVMPGSGEMIEAVVACSDQLTVFV